MLGEIVAESNYNRTTLIVSIVNWNAVDLIIQCVASVFNIIKKYPFEIVIVDNNSSDGSVQKLEEIFPSLNIIKNKFNVGYARAHNQVLSSSKSDYILLLNPDCILTDGVVDDMLDYLVSNPRVGIAGPKVLSQEGKPYRTVVKFPNLKSELAGMLRAYFPPFGSRLSKLLASSPKILCDSDEVPLSVEDTISGPFLLMNKNMLEEIGYLDEDFFLFSEENDICWRAKEKGWERIFFPDRSVYHLLGESRKKAPPEFSVYHMHRSRLIFFLKHYGKMHMILLGMIYFFFGSYALCLSSIKKTVLSKLSPKYRQTDYSAICFNVIKSVLDVFLGYNPPSAKRIEN